VNACLRLSLLLLAGCGRCGAQQPEADGGPEAPEAVVPLPPARAWAFQAVRGRPEVAAPSGCRLRAPVLQAPVRSTTGFVAEPGSLATLVIADTSEDGAQLLASGAMRFDAAGAVAGQAPVPWFSPDAVPRLGRTEGGRWLGTIAERDDAGAWRALLWRDGAVEPIGSGDRFEAVDLWCDAGLCALLTSRLGRVAMPGAEVRIGAATAPLADWTTVAIEPQRVDSDAHPLGIVRSSRPAGGEAPRDGSALRVALIERGECVLFAIEQDRARETGRIPAPDGVLDIVGIPEATAMLHAAPVGDDGCWDGSVSAVAKVRFAQAGRQTEIAMQAPPVRGALRLLARGALATWMMPLGCGAARKVVYAVKLDGAGQPIGKVIPVGDAKRYAVASEGDDVDLWLQHPDAVTWMRLHCDG
jgi:hypothetical protein